LERFNDFQDISAVKVRSTRTKGKRKRRTVTTRTHDTLRAVALRELGDSTRWKDLQRWNSKLKRTDPDLPLRQGTHVSIRG
jgi:nucleoid-associated protein YgaU